jgi:hypothetical protein
MGPTSVMLNDVSINISAKGNMSINPIIQNNFYCKILTVNISNSYGYEIFNSSKSFITLYESLGAAS